MIGAVPPALAHKLGVFQNADPDTGEIPAPFLKQIQITATDYDPTQPVGTLIGTLSGGHPQGNVVFSQDIANAVVRSGANILIGSGTPVPAPGSEQSYQITIIETLIGASNSPRKSTINLKAKTPAPVVVVKTKTVEAVGALTRSGIKAFQLAAGASISGTNSAHWNVAADGSGTVSDTGQGALAGPYTFTVTGDSAVDTLVIPVETGNVLDVNNYAEWATAVLYCIPTSRTTDWIISPRDGSIFDGGSSTTNQRSLTKDSVTGRYGALRGELSSPNLVVTSLAAPTYNSSTGLVSGTGAPAFNVIKVYVNGVLYGRAEMADANGNWSIKLAPNPGAATITAKAWDRVAFANRQVAGLSTVSGGSITTRARKRDGCKVTTSLGIGGIGPLLFEKIWFARVSQHPVQDSYIQDPSKPNDPYSTVVTPTNAFNVNSSEPGMLDISPVQNVVGQTEYYPITVFTDCTFQSDTTNVDAYQQAIRHRGGDAMVVQDCRFSKNWRCIIQDSHNFMELKRNTYEQFTNDVVDAYQSASYSGAVGRRLLLVVLDEVIYNLAETVTQSNNHSDWLQLGALNPLFSVTSETVSSGGVTSANPTPNTVKISATVNGVPVTYTQTTAASSNNADAWRAFTQNGTNPLTFFGNGAPEWRASATGAQWLRWDKDGGYGTAGIYHIRASSSDAANSAPKDWTLEGSNDGTTWTVIDTQTNQTGWANNETRFFWPPKPPVVPQLVAYRYVRLNITAVNNPATPVCINEWQQGAFNATNQIIDFLVADNYCVMATDVKVQATQPGEHDHSLLPILGHYENNFVVGSTANLVRCFYSGPGDRGLLIKNNTILQTRFSLVDKYPAPYNSYGGGGTNQPGGVVFSRTGHDVTLQNNIMGFIWENYGPVWTSDPPSPRTVARFGGAYTVSGNLYSQCYKRNTGDGQSYPEIFANLDNIFTYQEPTAAELARNSQAKIGWVWSRAMPTLNRDLCKAWIKRNFTTVGAAAGKGRTIWP